MQNQTNYLNEAKLAELRSVIDSGLERFTEPVEGCPARLNDAIRYSVLAPGKRLRPMLALLACEAVGGEWASSLPVACAVEMVHVYSLIHDDLPSMDNDDLRRGLPTCHRKFDDATAILAGDSLQMLAIEVICSNMPEAQVAACCQILSTAAGRRQLVGGQADDLAAEGRFGDNPSQSAAASPLEYLKSIHRRKTGALIVASLCLGGVAGGALPEQLGCLEQYGKAIGLAFQIVDDCLDVESTAEQLGKNTRKDSSLGKLTYPGLLGLSESRHMASQLVADAIQAIEPLGDRIEGLVELAQFVVSRKK